MSIEERAKQLNEIFHKQFPKVASGKAVWLEMGRAVEAEIIEARISELSAWMSVAPLKGYARAEKRLKELRRQKDVLK